MVKKFYGVKRGHTPGVYDNWSDAQESVNGYPGADFKKFSSYQDAETYINDEVCNELTDMSNSSIEKIIDQLDESEVVLFTDGTYSKEKNRYGYGLIIKSKDIEDYHFKSDNDPRYLESSNIAGELTGVMDGVKACIDKGYKKIYLFYDLEGIEKWAKYEYTAKKPVTKDFVKFVNEEVNIEIEYYKVKAHSKIKYNEIADSLAKKSTENTGYRTYESGNVYIDFLTEGILHDLVKSTQKEFESQNLSLEITREMDNDKLLKIVLKIGKETITIWFYRRKMSVYIQGKYNIIYKKLMNNLIQNFTDKSKLVHALNLINFENISDRDVNENLKLLLPDYRGDVESKIYILIKQSVYNYLLNQLEYEYSGLTNPIFRCTEHVLHGILGDKMGLETYKTKGNNKSNNFSFFDKDHTTDLYYCNHSSKDLLTESQLKLLNDTYNFKQKERNNLSHYPDNDFDAHVITDINVAKDIIKEGFDLFNQYHKLFVK